MDWLVQLNGGVSVDRDGERLGPPPTRAAAVLLIGLLADPGEWLLRSNVAARLYPGEEAASARTALRQTVRRLRVWLGEDAIEATSDHLRLSPRCRLGSKSFPLPHDDHEWIADIEGEWQSALDGSHPAAAIRDAILAAATVDPDEARALLAASVFSIWQLPARDISALLQATRPSHLQAPHSHSYLEVKSLFELHNCDLVGAARSSVRAYRAAVEHRAHRDASRIGAQMLFRLAELGDIGSAASWRSRLGDAPTASQAEFTNASSAVLWNGNELEVALDMMTSQANGPFRGSRRERVTYWSNLMILAAHAGNVRTSEHARERLEEEALTPLDDPFLHHAASYAAGWNLMTRGQPAMAIAAFEQAAAASHWPVTKLYVHEALALAHARNGNKPEAESQWRAAVSLLRPSKSPLNPRRSMLRRQIAACF